MEMNNKDKVRGFSTPLVIVIVVAVAAAAAFLLLRDSTPDTAPSNAQVEPEGDEGTPATEEDAEVTETDSNSVIEEPLDESPVREVAVEAGSFYYAPKEIRVKAGERVRITMTSKDMMHDFNIDALGVKLPITKAGNSGTVEFLAETPGTYEYYCSVGNHRQMGQKGTLIVE